MRDRACSEGAGSGQQKRQSSSAAKRSAIAPPMGKKTKCRAALLPLEAPEEKYSEGAALAAVLCVRKHVSADALGVADPTRTAGRGR
jgi:hypothetical protein